MCEAKHTIVQIADVFWVCPNCGAPAPSEHSSEMGFIIESSVDGSDEDCDLLHEEDECKCYKCGKVFTGKEVAEYHMRKSSVVPCPHCKGTGVVPKKGE